MNRLGSLLATISLLGFLGLGCTTQPQNEAALQSLSADSVQELARMKTQDSGLESFLQQSFGYAIFPSVGKGALIAGGAYGHGEVYRQGQFAGYADITQATIGLQAGGEAFSELLVFQNADALVRFETGQLTFSANASAVILKSGEAATNKFADGVAIFVSPKSGFMLEAAIGGQSFSYVPAEPHQAN